MPLRQRSALLGLLVASSTGTSAHAKGFRLAWGNPPPGANVPRGGGGGALLQDSEVVTALNAPNSATKVPPSSRASTRTRERRRDEWHAEGDTQAYWAEGGSSVTSLDSDYGESEGGVSTLRRGATARQRRRGRNQRSNRRSDDARRREAGSVKRPAYDYHEAYESLSEVEEGVTVAPEQSGLNRSVTVGWLQVGYSSWLVSRFRTMHADHAPRPLLRWPPLPTATRPDVPMHRLARPVQVYQITPAARRGVDGLHDGPGE